MGVHPEGLIAVSVRASSAANALGVLLAAVAKSERQPGGISILLVVTLAAICGALNANQDILMRGDGIAEILPECAVLLAMAVAMFGVAVRKFKWD